MTIHHIALTRDKRERSVLSIEAETLDQVLDALMPYLADDAHVSQADTGADIVYLAALRLNAARAQQAFEDAIAQVKAEEERQIGGDQVHPGDPGPGRLGT